MIIYGVKGGLDRTECPIQILWEKSDCLTFRPFLGTMKNQGGESRR